MALRPALLATLVMSVLAGPVIVDPMLVARPAAGRAQAPHGSTPAEEEPEGSWPLRPIPEIVADFAPPADPWGAGHRGVDLQGTAGQSVRAALAGQVSFAGSLAGRGVVVISHGATRTTYEPVTALPAVGDHVAQGASIGRLELARSHCFPRACLHWGWLRGETYLDPLLLVGGGPVRLLPWAGLPVLSEPGGVGLVTSSRLLDALP